MKLHEKEKIFATNQQGCHIVLEGRPRPPLRRDVVHAKVRSRYFF